MLVIPAFVMNVARPADAASCTIVPNPTPTNHTECPDASLPFANLRNLNLDYANLAGANLNHADLSSTTLDYADLTGANLQSADLFDVSFTNGTADGADFDNSYLLGTTFDSTHLDGASFTGTGVVPTSRDAEATSEDGANVSFPMLQLTPGIHLSYCTPNSGSLFAPGLTTVNCTIFDDFGGTATGSFSVYVSLPSHTQAEPALLSTAGNILSMTAKVTDPFTGAPIVGGPVEFYANNGSPYERYSHPTCSATTDAAGVATCSLIDTGNAQKGISDLLAVIENGGYTAFFLGSGHYTVSNGSASLVG
jgi:uncharacterized protein YjbI with pentapeptide repeats